MGAIRFGALDLYRALPGPLSSEQVADALVYADTAGMLLLDATAATGRDAAELEWQHNDRTGGHAVVHQATGMLLVQLGVDAETAFARLRAHAYAAGLPLAQVARDIVERRLRLEPDPPPATP
jgi:AmiR/NasT family two-component response regulator